jgi:UDPglucose 6-dehydrogenase
MVRRHLAVIGAGYVGLAAAACLASLGHRVVCSDVDPERIAQLRAGRVASMEPDLPELVAEGVAAGRLDFVVGAGAAVEPETELVVLCLPTPMSADGAADLTALDAVLAEVRELLPSGCVVVNKSTVPPGTAARTAVLLDRPDVAVVSNPEFLREGSAVHDFLHPDRIVVGSDRREPAERVAALYSRLGAPVLLTDAASAELVKYAANCFLGMKLSYVNALAELCERLGADVEEVTLGMGYDRRIGQAFLRPGPGWGGPCLPKDSHALLQISRAAGFDFPLLAASLETNERQSGLVVEKVRAAARGRLDGRRIALLGLTFKAGTDDLRESPASRVAADLLAAGAEVTAFDPGCPGPVPGRTDGITVTDAALTCVKDADVIVVLTEWPEFRALDWSAIARAAASAVVVDTRNLLDPDVLHRSGVRWIGIGKPDDAHHIQHLLRNPIG